MKQLRLLFGTLLIASLAQAQQPAAGGYSAHTSASTTDGYSAHTLASTTGGYSVHTSASTTDGYSAHTSASTTAGYSVHTSVSMTGASGVTAAPASRSADGDLPLIPYPQQVSRTSDSFVLDRHTSIQLKGPFPFEKAELTRLLGHYLGAQAFPAAGAHRIFLQQDVTLKGLEAYKISVNNKEIVLAARTTAGMFDALQTLRQLLPAEVEDGKGTQLVIPGAEILDSAAYGWRGMHLDVSRHFFSTDYLKKYIDIMALYKLNKLHLHLTDDQGWRIEIKKYPKLATEGAWRTFNDQDSLCMKLAKETDNPDLGIDPKHIRASDGKYGGSYTQEEMRDIIRYAAARHIEIIPEVDMPGHMMAAIALYPWLTCDGAKGNDWRQGFSTPICPFTEASLKFAEDVFTEIADLFPSHYIHIGGDEVERKAWENSPAAQAFMKDHHIATVAGLQSYFNNYIEAFLKKKGKTVVGWDEVVEGGIDSSAMVMFWRTWVRTAPKKAAANGNKIVMVADGPLYFDAIPDKTSLSAVYHYNPVDAVYGLTPAETPKIIGVQAALWTEKVPTEGRADYLLMPRLSALAEVAWTHRNFYDSYLQRLGEQLPRLDRMGVGYRLPDVLGLAERRVFVDTASLWAEAPAAGLTLRYTTDGSAPVAPGSTAPGSSGSAVLDKPLVIDHAQTIKIAAFTPSGRRGDVYKLDYSQQSYATPVTPAGGGSGGSAAGTTSTGTTPAGSTPSGSTAGSATGATTTGTTPAGATAGSTWAAAGLTAKIFTAGPFKSTADIKGAPARTAVQDAVHLPADMPMDGMGMKLEGFITVPKTGIYSFYLVSDDGSQLNIAGRLVVDNDGLHPATERSGQIALAAGAHAFALDYIDGGGGGTLKLSYSVNGGPVTEVPADWLTH